MSALVLLAITWFVALAGTGAWTSFFALYLRQTGVDPTTIGLLVSVLPAARIVATPLWAWVGDRTGRGTRVLQIASFVSTAGASLLLGHPSTATAVLGLAIFAAARGPIGPLMDAQAVTLLERRHGHAAGYGRLRLWGSLGFLAGGFLAGTQADRDPGFPMAFAVAAWSLGALLTLALPGDVKAKPAHIGPALRRLFGQAWCPPFLLASVLHGAALCTYDTFYALLVADRGLPSTWTGAALVAGILAETLVLGAGPWLLARFGAERLVLLGMTLGVVRWALTATLTDPWALTAVQSLHGVVFGMFWIGGVERMRQAAGEPIRASAQALFTVAGYGVGALVSGLLASVALPVIGTVGGFAVGAGLSAAAAALAVWSGRRGFVAASAGGR